MSKFADSAAGQAFIATAASRETSPEIMQAIAFHARDKAEAVKLWRGGGFGVVCNPVNLWATVTKNGLHEAEDFTWGAAGTGWWNDIKHFG